MLTHIFKHLFAIAFILVSIFVFKTAGTIILTANAQDASTLSEGNIEEDYMPDDIVPYLDPKTAGSIYENSFKELDSLPNIKATTTKPNIVVIMLDDVNPIDGRFFTRERTPAIYNNIISKGINFTKFYGETSLCCPGRVGFLTGQHTQNHGVADLDGTKFNPEETIATELKSKGYFTILTGKYVNAFANIPKNKAVPPGWSRFDAIYENQGRYYRYDWISGSSGKLESIKYFGSSPSDYSTDVISRYAVKSLKEAPADKPIFAYINPYSIHNPKTVAPRYVNDPRCSDISPWKTANVFEQDISDKSEYFKDLKNGNPATGYSLKRNCEVLLATDDLVRKVKMELDAQNRLHNTLFILTADNGYGFGEHRIPSKTAPYTTHIPLYIAWPAGRGIEPTTNTSVLSNIDIAPTLCELAGCVMGPYPNGQSKSDGISFLPILKNQTVELKRDIVLESQPIKPIGTDGYSRPTWWAVRTTHENPYGLWHYIEYATGEKELYDLSNGPCFNWSVGSAGDPCELDNLLSPHANRPKPSNLNEIKEYLAGRLKQLKNERGFSAYMPQLPTTTPTPTPTH